MKKRVAKRPLTPPTGQESIGSTGTIGDDGVFVPDPPGTSIFSPARLNRQPGKIGPSGPRGSTKSTTRTIKAKPPVKKVKKAKKAGRKGRWPA